MAVDALKVQLLPRTAIATAGAVAGASHTATAAAADVLLVPMLFYLGACAVAAAPQCSHNEQLDAVPSSSELSA